MQAIKNKISSQRGASLTFALLIFLVCAVVGSVVLTAGTAASGRMSKVTEMDQRYYSVNSAARLLTDTIKDKSVVVIETKPNDGSPAQYRYEDGDTYSTDSFESIVKEAADYCVHNAVWDELNKIYTYTPRKDYTYTISVGDKDDLTATVKEEITDRGNLVLTVQNKNTDDDYAIKLTFPGEITQTATDRDDKTITRWKFVWSDPKREIVGGDLRVK